MRGSVRWDALIVFAGVAVASPSSLVSARGDDAPARAGDGTNADAPDFVPEAEPESRTVERFRVPSVRDRVYEEAPSAAGPTRVWIVSVVDLTCEPCRKHVAQLLTLSKRHPKPLPVEIQFRQLPLGLSPASRAVADAVVAARRLGFGREFLSRLAAASDRAGDTTARDAFAWAGTKTLRFGDLLATKIHGHEVDADLHVAKAFGVSSAPTYFVNGRRFSGLQSDEAVDTIILSEIAVASRVAAKRARAKDMYAALTEDAKTQSVGPARARLDDVKPTELRLGASPTRGAAGAPVVVSVFSDFYCPHGVEHAATLKKLLEEFGGKIRVVFKHRPVSVFAAARVAACAAIAAQEQAKFWEMHDKLVGSLAPGHAREDSEATDEQKIPKRLVAHAAEIKLDLDAFRAVMEGDRCQKEIDDDLALAAKLGVTGTPTTFVNGRRIVGAASIDVFRAVIEEELKKAKRN